MALFAGIGASGGSRHRAGLGVGAVLALAALFVGQAAEAATDRTVQRGQYFFLTKSKCSNCHGWAADGRGHPRSPGNAPSLRTMELTREQIIETVLCGRPGTPMPAFDRMAYIDDRCYGLVADDLGDDKPTAGQKSLRLSEVEMLVDYLEAYVIGAPPRPNYEDCVRVFGADAGKCANMLEAEAAANAAEN